jgi:WD40 repeat protein
MIRESDSGAATGRIPCRTFLCHNSADKPFVKEMADRLELDFGVLHFLDVFDIPTGEAFRVWIERSLGDSTGCAIFLGANGWGPTHLWEAQMAIRRHAADTAFRLIPVALPGIREGDMAALDGGNVFRDLNWADFRSGADDQNALDKLYATLTGFVSSQGMGPARLTPYQVRRDAARWTKSGQHETSVLYRGAQLEEAEQLTRKVPDLAAKAEIGPFLLASARRQRQTWLWAALIACTVALLLIAFVITIFSELREKNRLRISRLLRNLSAQAASLVTKRPQVSALIGLELERLGAPISDTLNRAIDELPERPIRTIRLGDEGESCFYFSQDSRHIIVLKGARRTVLPLYGDNRGDPEDSARADAKDELRYCAGAVPLDGPASPTTDPDAAAVEASVTSGDGTHFAASRIQTSFSKDVPPVTTWSISIMNVAQDKSIANIDYTPDFDNSDTPIQLFLGLNGDYLHIHKIINSPGNDRTHFLGLWRVADRKMLDATTVLSSEDDSMTCLTTYGRLLSYITPGTPNRLVLSRSGDLTAEIGKTRGGIGQSAFSHSGLLLAVPAPGTVELWDTKRRIKERELKFSDPASADPASVSFSPDDRFIVVAFKDDDAIVLAVERDSPKMRIHRNSKHSSMVFSATSDLMAVRGAGQLSVYSTQIVRSHDVDFDESMKVVEYNSARDIIAVWDDQNTVTAKYVSSGATLWKGKVDPSVGPDNRSRVTISPDGSFFLLTGDDRVVAAAGIAPDSYWQVATYLGIFDPPGSGFGLNKRVPRELTSIDAYAHDCAALRLMICDVLLRERVSLGDWRRTEDRVRISPDSKLVAYRTPDKGLTVLNLGEGPQSFADKIQYQGDLLDFGFSSDNQRVTTATTRGVWSSGMKIRANDQIAAFTALDAKLSPGGEYVLVRGAGSICRVVSLISKAADIRVPCGTDVLFDPSNRYLQIDSGLIGLENRRLVATLANETPLRAASFSKSGNMVFDGSSLISLPSGETIKTARKIKQFVGFSNDGNYMIDFEPGARKAHYSRWSPKEMREEACAKLDSNFSRQEWSSTFPGENYHRTCESLPNPNQTVSTADPDKKP